MNLQIKRGIYEINGYYELCNLMCNMIRTSVSCFIVSVLRFFCLARVDERLAVPGNFSMANNQHRDDLRHAGW